MDARILSRGPLFLAGMGFFGDPFARASAWDEENEIGSLWKRFQAYAEAWPDALRDRVGGSVGYELHISHAETGRTGRYEVFVGVELGSPAPLPAALSAKLLGAGDYAVVAVRGEDIRADWMGRIYAEILPALGRRADESFSFERYDERFKGMDRLEESEIEYYVPLLPAEAPAEAP
ncbi:MAG TPA: GyrI-like domain-containing protein [Spirochaetales bacterium]|nr:GyrI-like domain-containing protein [Spirochaetales bacterium]HRY53537.1 GyrI-like domain-containing protein [Spirochaetia bacterium]HRZ63903.1 GyrI-like domain-containing protein [Spirochaetia bacterium]